MEITAGTTLAFEVAWLMTGAGELVTLGGEGLLTVAAPVQDEVNLRHRVQTC